MAGISGHGYLKLETGFNAVIVISGTIVCVCAGVKIKNAESVDFTCCFCT